MDAVDRLTEHGVCTHTACEALGVSRATYYRHRRTPPRQGPPRPGPTPARALSPEQRKEVLEALCSEAYRNLSPAAVWAKLLDDQGRYLCSERTMYRILASEGASRERRHLRSHPAHEAPALVATAPNQVWSWDITKLRGAHKGQWFYLYVVLDIYSRYVVGWLAATRESAELARWLLAESARKQNIGVDCLTIHSDRGAPMTAKKVADLFDDLGITRSLSRPRVSNDNAISEAQFKTLKYQPTFPETFEDIGDVRHHIDRLLTWYNTEHYHSGIGLLTPATVHHGLAQHVLSKRQEVLDRAYARHPERFVTQPPVPPALPTEVRIGRPATTLTTGVILP